MIRPDDMRLIEAIAVRAVNLYRRYDVRAIAGYIESELMIVHSEVVPLRLKDFLDGRDDDFMHDIAGIHRHLEIGKPSKLNDCFLPRFANV